MSDFNPGGAIFYPDEASAAAIMALHNVRENSTRGVPFPIEGTCFADAMPGQLVSVIAQTSNYKSAFLHFWERELAKKLHKDGRKDEGIIHVSVEECIEEQVYLDMAHETGIDAGEIAVGKIQDWDRLQAAAVQIGKIPIYRIGDSLSRAEDFPHLYISNMIRCIQYLAEGRAPGRKPVKPAALFFDYLQAFPFDPEVRRLGNMDMQRRLQVREDTYRLRQAAAYFECPVIVAVQAKQHLDGARGGTQQPGVYDGEESASIAQRSDRIVTLWMPSKTHTIGESIQIGGEWYKVSEDAIFVKIAKQRGGYPAGRTYLCKVDFTRNTIRIG